MISDTPDTDIWDEPDDDDFAGLITEAEIRAAGGTTTMLTRKDVELADSRVQATGVLEKIARWREEDRVKTGAGGRPALISDRVVLILLLLLVRERSPLWVSEMRNLLWLRLTEDARRFLNLPPATHSGDDATDGKNWYNNVWNALQRLLVTMDPYPAPRNKLMNRQERERVKSLREKNTMRRMKERLDWFSNQWLDMTFQMQPRQIRRLQKKMDVAIDQTCVTAPSRRGRSEIDKKTGKEVLDLLVLELDADWYPKNPANRIDPDSAPKKDLEWGYAANIASRVSHNAGEEAPYPLIALSFTLSRPNEDVAGETVRSLQSILDRGHEPGRVNGDKGYFANLRPETLHIPVNQMGWDVNTDYLSNQLGIKGGKAGALQIEGEHYCPAMPKALITVSIDKADNRIDEDTRRKRIDERQPYALRNKERPDERGHVPKMCPAHGPGATIECPLRALHKNASKKPKPHVLEQNLPEVPDRICTQSSVDFGPEDGIRQAQSMRYGSEEWARTYRHDRNTIESFNSHIKEPGYENLAAASRRRLRGFAAQQVLVTMLIVAANIRKILTFLRDQARKPHANPGKPAIRRRDREGHSTYVRKRHKGPPIEATEPVETPLRT